MTNEQNNNLLLPYWYEIIYGDKTGIAECFSDRENLQREVATDQQIQNFHYGFLAGQMALDSEPQSFYEFSVKKRKDIRQKLSDMGVQYDLAQGVSYGSGHKGADYGFNNCTSLAPGHCIDAQELWGLIFDVANINLATGLELDVDGNPIEETPCHPLPEKLSRPWYKEVYVFCEAYRVEARKAGLENPIIPERYDSLPPLYQKYYIRCRYINVYDSTYWSARHSVQRLYECDLEVKETLEKELDERLEFGNGLWSRLTLMLSPKSTNLSHPTAKGDWRYKEMPKNLRQIILAKMQAKLAGVK